MQFLLSGDLRNYNTLFSKLSGVQFKAFINVNLFLYIYGLERDWQGIHLYLVEDNFISDLKTLSTFSSALGHSLWTVFQHGRDMCPFFICRRIEVMQHNQEQSGWATALTGQNQIQDKGLGDGSSNRVGLASPKTWVWSPRPNLQKLGMVVHRYQPSNGDTVTARSLGYWPLSLAYLVSSRPVTDPVIKLIASE